MVAFLKDKKNSREMQEAQLKKLGAKPIAPKRPRLTVSNATPEAIVKTFEIARPTLGIYSAEGSQFLSGHSFTKEKKNEKRSASLTLCGAVETYNKVTIAHGEQTLVNKRLALHLMIQPHIAKNVLNDDDLACPASWASALSFAGLASRIGTRI